MSGQIFMLTCTFWLCEIAPILAICFNVLNGGEKNCRPCGTLRIVFRNVSAPDLQDKLNDLRIQERKVIVILPVLSSMLKLLQESLLCCIQFQEKLSKNVLNWLQKFFRIVFHAVDGGRWLVKWRLEGDEMETMRGTDRSIGPSAAASLRRTLSPQFN